MTTVLRGAVGAGKTEAVIAHISQLVRDASKPFPKIWVLLATKRQEVAFRQRLIDLQDQETVYFHVEFFNFYTLNERLLNLAHSPVRRIDSHTTEIIVKILLQKMVAEQKMQFFASIAQTTGFLQAITEFLNELKQNLIEPEQFSEAVVTQKDRELAELYHRYQDVLREYDLMDQEGEGWLALETLSPQQPPLVADVDLIVVDGYDQFSYVQATLLASLSRQVGELLITLTHPAQPDSMVSGRFDETFERLQVIHEALAIPFDVAILPVSDQKRHADLALLSQWLGQGRQEWVARGGLNLIEAPEPFHEVGAVMRTAKQLLLNGVAADDILIAIRDFTVYGSHLRHFAQLYGIPIVLQQAEPLIHNPMIATLIDILGLVSVDGNPANSFYRRDVLDVLRSPYVDLGLTDDQILLLDRVSHDYQVLAGHANWTWALDKAHEAQEFEFDDEESDRRIHISTAEFSALSVAVDSFFDALLELPKEATYREFVAVLDQLIGQDIVIDPDDDDYENPNKQFSLELPKQLRKFKTASWTVSRDIQALNQFKDVLRGMVAAQEFLMKAMSETEQRLSWETFLKELESALGRTRLRSGQQSRNGQILATSATEARGLPHQVLFILGLSEGLFPAEVPEDLIYLNSERDRLKQAGIDLPSQAERSDDEGLFYELINLPSHQLFISRPTIREGKHWVESHLWRMVRDVFPDMATMQYRIGQVLMPDEVTSPDEALLSLIHQMVKRDSEVMLPLMDWASGQETQFLEQIHLGIASESARISNKPHDAYSGQLANPQLISLVGEKLAKTPWSATRLNSYGTCPYQFFANYVLGLDAFEEPEEGMDSMQRGTLFHSILEQTYGTMAQESLEIHPDHVDDALEILRDVADPILRDAPRKLQFIPNALWAFERESILRDITKLIRNDFSFSSPISQNFKGVRRVWQVEQTMGFDRYLFIPIGDGQSIAVRCKIDRIDIIDDQNLVIVDYKTGKTQIDIKEMQEGRNFQMAIYLLALESWLKAEGLAHDLTIRGGFFWHTGDLSTSGMVTLNEMPSEFGAINDAQAHLVRYLGEMQMGKFTESPSKVVDGKCSKYCSYSQLCRIASTSLFKKDA